MQNYCRAILRQIFAFLGLNVKFKNLINTDLYGRHIPLNKLLLLSLQVLNILSVKTDGLQITESSY